MVLVVTQVMVDSQTAPLFPDLTEYALMGLGIYIFQTMETTESEKLWAYRRP
jgi:hypothetical protein